MESLPAVCPVRPPHPPTPRLLESMLIIALGVNTPRLE